MNQDALPGLLTVILAGGESNRMGTDKALLPCGNMTLIEKVTREALSLGFLTVISTAQGRHYPMVSDVPHVEDLYPHTGPIGAIRTVMESLPFDYYLFWPVDMPLLTPSLWMRLMDAIRGEKFSLVWPRTGDKIHPLPGIYHRNTLTWIRRRMAFGHLSLYGMMYRNPTKIIDCTDLSPYFANLNTPDDRNICEQEG